jgi:hypothetical protein
VATDEVEFTRKLSETHCKKFNLKLFASAKYIRILWLEQKVEVLPVVDRVIGELKACLWKCVTVMQYIYEIWNLHNIVRMAKIRIEN